VEYYRAPVPPKQFWDSDFARIRAAGLRIVRSFTFWNWLEPQPGQFEFDDLDYFYELAAKHDLKVWLDITVATHGACPEWMLLMHPDMRVVWPDGRVQQQTAGEATPQGIMTHNYDHPKWPEYAERYIRTIVGRYKDHPNLLVWGTCDGVNLAAAWADSKGYPPYNDYTIEKYINWLKKRFTLEQLNERLMRRYRCWEYVQPPRSNDALVEMMLYRQFHYENMVEMLGWMAELIDRLDGKHEQRSHGWFCPRQWDEAASSQVDSWGVSMPSADSLTSDNPYCVATRCFGFQWSRAIGREGRWWNEEIYAGSQGRIHARGKQSTPEELTTYLWLSLVEGAAGALFWQYRPEYMSFEAPGLNLAALDGEPTARWTAVEEAAGQIKAITEHLPLAIPQAKLATAYSALSQEVFMYAGLEQVFNDELMGLYRSLWSSNIPQDVVSPNMDWSKYKVVYLPNFAVLDETAISRIRRTLKAKKGPSLIVDGHFGTFTGSGMWSFQPPEGLADILDVRVADFNKITDRDIRRGNNVLKTEYGEFAITNECDYAILEPKANAGAIATLNGEVVAVSVLEGRLSWWGLSLCRVSAGTTYNELILPMVASYGIESPFYMTGDRVVAYRRGSKSGGSLILLFNLEEHKAKTTVRPCWHIRSASNVLRKEELAVKNGVFEIEIASGKICIVHCIDG